MVKVDPALLRRDLERDEAVRTFLYDDADGKRIRAGVTVKGNPTIGIGYNLDTGIDQDVIDLLYSKAVERAGRSMIASFPWFAELSEVRQRALLNMCFNLGPTSMAAFAPTWEHLRRGDWAAVGSHLRASLWHMQVGARAERIVFMLVNNRDPEVV